MKHLREYIRQILLTEAAKGPTDIPEGYFIRLEETGDFAEFEFVKLISKPNMQPVYRTAVQQSNKYDEVRGSIQLYSVDSYEVGPCSNAFMISWSGATSGYGPMLYDLAMEYATQNGGGLIADRSTVSPEARAVWNYYLNNRSDIEIVQLDDPNNELTDVEEDNCDQEIAGGQNYLYPKPADRVDPDWPTSALSKMYRKTNNSTTRELMALGKLI